VSRRPLVSVVVPTHGDRAPRLRAALATVCAQEDLAESFDVEIVVVDDASSGPTHDVVGAVANARLIRFETSRGAAAARNAGLGAATGRYVAFMDDDDLWLPRRLQLQVGALERAETPSAAYGQLVGVFPDGTSDLTPGGAPPSGWIFDAVFRGDVSFGTVLVPREVLGADGFDERLPAGEDRDWLLRLALRIPFVYVRGPVAVYVASKRDWVAFSNAKIESWFLRRDKLLALADGVSNHEAIRRLVESGTWVHVISMLVKARRFEEARDALLRQLARSPIDRSDGWYSSSMKGLLRRLALQSASTKETRSLLVDVKRANESRHLADRLNARLLCADIWTEVALHYAAQQYRDDRRAATAAALAIFENPFEPIKRPGLVRLLGRGPAALLNGNRVYQGPDRSISNSEGMGPEGGRNAVAPRR
jgi:glycosyltransferase involved in cell wall biosynthesis